MSRIDSSECRLKGGQRSGTFPGRVDSQLLGDLRMLWVSMASPYSGWEAT